MRIVTARDHVVFCRGFTGAFVVGLTGLRFVSGDGGEQDTDQKKCAEQSSGFSDEMDGGVARGHNDSP